MKNLITLALCFITSLSFGQISVKDTVALYTSQFNEGSLTLSELNNTLSHFFGTLPSDLPITRYEKEFQRSMYFWKDRLSVTSDGVEEKGVYTRALVDYLDTPTCAGNDHANWKFHFDANPVNNYDFFGETTLGSCVETGNHTAGIIFSVYMNPENTNIILAGAGASGIWRTSNGGSDWENVTDNLRIPALSIREIIDISKPSQPVGKYLLAITGRDKFHDSYSIGILKSNNYGATWTQHNIPLVDGIMPFIRQVTKPYSESNTIFACSETKIYRSTDLGYTWSELGSIPATALKFYSLSSSSGSEDMLYISTKGMNSQIWRTRISTIDWENITPVCKIAAASVLETNIDMTFDFDGGITDSDLDSNSYLDTATSINYHITTIPIDGDDHLAIPSIVIPGWTFTDGVGGLYLSYDLGVVKKEGDIFISCNAGLPEGGEIEFYVVDNGIDIDDDLSMGEGTYIGSFEYGITEDVVPYSATFSVTGSGYISHIVARFEYNPPSLYGGLTPIFFDDFHFEIMRDAQEIVPLAIGISESNGDELYAAVQAIDSAVTKYKIMTIKSEDKGETWEFSHIGSGYNTGGTGDVLAANDNFTAGYGETAGFYHGGVKMVRYDNDLEDYYEMCTQHDDVRDIQIVKNVSGDNHLIVGDDGGVSYSADGGITWTSLNGSGLPVTQFYSIGLNRTDNKTIIGGCQDNGTYKGAYPDWTIIGGGDGGASDFSKVHDNKYFFTQNSTLMTYEDEVLIQDFSTGDEGLTWFFNSPTEIDPITGNTLFSGYRKNSEGHDNGTIIKHDIDPIGGIDDPVIYDFSPAVAEIGAIEISPNNTNYIYAASGYTGGMFENNKFFRSSDYGVTYQDLSLTSTDFVKDEAGVNTSLTLNTVLSYKNANAIETDPDNYKRLWIGISGLQKIDGIVVGDKFRVLYSDNKGDTWQDYSIGLPPFPVNDLIYQEGTNDRLFAATDVGIFYREAGMDTWVCFQEGMPATFATDLEINYCTQELVAGTFGRGIWSSSINLHDSEPILITEDETIASELSLDHNLIIETGVTLTITGTLNMAGYKNIIVKKGAHLIVDGGTITNSCGAFWGGIDVWGDRYLPQLSSNQGKLTIKNNAIIEHAIVAVSLTREETYNQTGGMVFAYSSTFRNNRKDVQYLTYQNVNGAGEPIRNTGIFSKVTFTWDNDFRTEFPLGHVTLYQVDGVTFKGCNFADDRTNPTSRYLTDNGIGNVGIRSSGSHYFVVPSCPFLEDCTGSLSEDEDWIPTTFTNLDFGIYASNTSSENNITVDRSIFENNLYGIEIINVNSPVFTRNIFEINGDTTNNFMTEPVYGIHAIRSKDLTIEENNFTHESGINTVYGLVCSDLGESDEQVYKNTFNRLNFGVVAQGKNRNLFGEKGLQFLCDSNYLNRHDHTVLGSWGDIVFPTYGVKSINGTASIPSGTIFSDTLPIVDAKHYRNSSSHLVTYNYYDGVPNQEPTATSGFFTPNFVDDENTCPTQLVENIYQEYTTEFTLEKVSEFGKLSADFTDAKNIYVGLVNGGNTIALLTDIGNLTSANKDDLRKTLSTYSPYLTQEVVRAVIDNTVDKFPHAWTYELIIANIEVAYQYGFMDFLSTKTAPLPSWMIDDIQSKVDAGVQTDMFIKQGELSALSAKKSDVARYLLLDLKNDTINSNSNAVRLWIQQKGNVLAETRVVDSYLQDADYVMAQSELDKLSLVVSTYPVHLQEELNDFIDLKNKIISVLSDGGHLDALSETDHVFMTDMAENAAGLAAYQAQELLCFFYGECRAYPIGAGSISSSMASKMIDFEEEIVKRAFAVYPNPANTWVTIVLPEMDESVLSELQITIIDLTGRIVYTKTIEQNADSRSNIIENWNTEFISNGTYLITVSDRNNNANYGTQKVTIQH